MADHSERRVALVTGGSRGIGAAIAERLARDGFDVLITYQKSADAAQKVIEKVKGHGVRGDAFASDAGDAAQASKVVDEAVKRFGRLDVLVNNAGVLEGGPLPDVSDEAFDRQFAVNVKATFLAARAAAKVLPDGGRIINIGSILGERIPMPGISIYSATKFAVAGLTRGWARDLGPKGITVNAVQPGPIATDMNPDSGDFADLQRSMIANGRYGQPDDVAEAVAFLASPAARQINGTTINVDGGMIA